MKKLYYSFIILLVAFIALVMPRAKAAGDFDDTAQWIGFIEDYETEIINGNEYITGAWVYIEKSSLPKGDYSVYYFFTLDYFQPDLTVLFNEMIGRRLIWNPFDNRASGPYNGAWWLLVGYEYISDDIADAYQYGYESGYNNGYSDGEQIGYDNGYGVGYNEGFGDGFDVGYEDGEQLGYSNGYSDGYGDGYDYGREQVLNSIENMEILYQDIVLPNGVKDEIIDNEILVDNVGVVVIDSSENWRYDGEGEDLVLFGLNYPFNYFYEKLTDVNKAISNKFEQGYNDTISGAYNMMFTTNNYFRIALLKTDLIGWDDSLTNQQKVNVFKQWLAAQKEAGEPLTVWYQYAEPKQYDLISLLRNEDGSFKDGYSKGYNDGRVTVQRENKSLLSVIPTTIGAIWLMISDFLSYEVFGLNLWSIIIMFASFSLLVLIIKMVI